MGVAKMPYEELNRIINSGQGGEMLANERTRRLLSGDATWFALQHAVEELSRTAPEDHDVLLLVDDLAVVEARYIEPHTFLFGGFDNDGNRTWIAMHFSQVSIRVVYLAKRGPSKVITGFSKVNDI